MLKIRIETLKGKHWPVACTFKCFLVHRAIRNIGLTVVELRLFKIVRRLRSVRVQYVSLFEPPDWDERVLFRIRRTLRGLRA